MRPGRPRGRRRPSRGLRRAGRRIHGVPGAIAVLLVIGQESGQVAQLGGRAGGDRASAVAIGTHRRPLARKRSRSWWMSACLERLVSAGGVGVFAHVVGVLHRNAGRADPLIGPDRVQQSLERGQFSLGQRRHLLRDFLRGCLPWVCRQTRCRRSASSRSGRSRSSSRHRVPC